MDTFNVILE